MLACHISPHDLSTATFPGVEHIGLWEDTKETAGNATLLERRSSCRGDGGYVSREVSGGDLNSDAVPRSDVCHESVVVTQKLTSGTT